MNITIMNLRELRQLCEKFGFKEFGAKLSKFCPASEDSPGGQIGSRRTERRKAFSRESFLFIVNGSEIEREASLFPAVDGQLSADSCARKFFLAES